MKFKPGDRVKFLNELGGGVIKRIISPSLVSVEIEDGFEVPVVPGELVLDIRGIQEEEIKKRNDMVAVPHWMSPDKNSKASDITSEEFEPDDRKTKIMRLGFRGAVSDGLYLAFVPHDQKWLMTGHLDIILLNHTSLDVLFSYFQVNDQGLYIGTDYDVLEPNTQILLATINREQIGSWMNGLIQFIFHTEKTSNLPLPANCEIAIKPSRIFNEASYRETPLLAEKAFIYSLLELQLHAKVVSRLKEDATGQIRKTAIEKKKEALIDRYRTNEKEAVVDLHIGELLNSIAGMTSHDMLKYQKDYFVKVLESAIAESYNKVTFIHGVGNGVLRDEIVKIMNEYENTRNQDASLAKFGVGAVDVIIGRK